VTAGKNIEKEIRNRIRRGADNRNNSSNNKNYDEESKGPVEYREKAIVDG
jgi:hypothetical protein